MQKWHKGWYLLRFQEHFWKRLLLRLNDIGVDTCCPMIYRGLPRKDKKNCIRHSKHPAFPGYIFVFFNPEDIPIPAIKRMMGVIDFVRCDGEIKAIRESTVCALKCIEAKVISSDNCSYECIGVSDEIVDKIIEIYNADSPYTRNSMLLTLIEYSNIQKEGRNAA